MRATRLLLTAVLAASAVLPAMAQQPSQAQANAVKQACRGDYMNVCSGVPTGGSAALQCLQQHAGSVSGGCEQALGALGGGGTAAAGAGSGAGLGGGAAAGAAGSLSPREQMAVLRTDCRRDFVTFCRGTPLGGGRAMSCLASHLPSLSQPCQSALLAARKGQ